jgi:hypothetical protein
MSKAIKIGVPELIGLFTFLEYLSIVACAFNVLGELIARYIFSIGICTFASVFMFVSISVRGAALYRPLFI